MKLDQLNAKIIGLRLRQLIADECTEYRQFVATANY